MLVGDLGDEAGERRAADLLARLQCNAGDVGDTVAGKIRRQFEHDVDGGSRATPGRCCDGFRNVTVMCRSGMTMSPRNANAGLAPPASWLLAEAPRHRTDIVLGRQIADVLLVKAAVSARCRRACATAASVEA